MTGGTLVFITNSDINVKSGASEARMWCYAKALSSKGINTIFTSVSYAFLKYQEPILIEDNIYLLGKTNQNIKKKSRKALPLIKEFNFLSVIRYLRLLNLKFKDYKDLTFLLYPSNFALSITTSIYLKILKKKKVFLEKNELHLGIALNMPVPYGFKKTFYFPALLLQILISALTDIIEISFDGIICISTRLYKYYNFFYKNLILIPIITDIKLGGQIVHEKSHLDIFRIGYTGTITEKRDGIFTLIKAISLIPKRENEIKCNLYGSITESNIKRLTLLINKYKLNKVVTYFGNYEKGKVKLIQSEQNLLVLIRPSNLQTNFGFSTKLAEYLSSGVPVLTTRHSDISNYIVNGENGFILEKLDSEQLKNKLTEIITKDNDQLNKIGEKGRLTALNHFNYINYSEKLINFLKQKT